MSKPDFSTTASMRLDAIRKIKKMTPVQAFNLAMTIPEGKKRDKFGNLRTLHSMRTGDLLLLVN